MERLLKRKQIPDELLEYFEEVVPDTKPCVVGDFFFGSGTSGIVAHKHGRKFIGIELSQEYLDDIAIPRIKKATKQQGWDRFK